MKRAVCAMIAVFLAGGPDAAWPQAGPAVEDFIDNEIGD